MIVSYNTTTRGFYGIKTIQIKEDISSCVFCYGSTLKENKTHLSCNRCHKQYKKEGV